MSDGAILTALFAGFLLIVLVFGVLSRRDRQRGRRRPGQQWRPIDRELEGDGRPLGASRRRDGNGNCSDASDSCGDGGDGGD